MREYVMIPFQVKEDRLDEAKKAINELISNVKEKEPGTLLYKSLQLKNDPTSFINFIIFADNNAHMKHRSAEYVMDFVKKLYELCQDEPFPVFLERFWYRGAKSFSKFNKTHIIRISRVKRKH